MTTKDKTKAKSNKKSKVNKTVTTKKKDHLRTDKNSDSNSSPGLLLLQSVLTDGLAFGSKSCSSIIDTSENRSVYQIGSFRSRRDIGPQTARYSSSYMQQRRHGSAVVT